jgi:hypothetical protein
MKDFTYFFLSSLVGLGFELRASHLQSMDSNAWDMPPVHFCSGYFGGGSHELFGRTGLEPLPFWSQPPK